MHPTSISEALTSSRFNYPSILTYHALDGRGGHTDGTLTEFEPGEEVLWTKKLDGSNTRILVETFNGYPTEDYAIGARETWLYAHGDRIIRPDHGIVPTLLAGNASGTGCVSLVANIMDKIAPLVPYDGLICVYGETFGGTNDMRHAAKYGPVTWFSVFDIAVSDNDDPGAPLTWIMPPTLAVLRAEAYQPRTVTEIHAVMNELRAADSSAYVEGYVLRSASRPWLKSKVRFESYEKTMARR